MTHRTGCRPAVEILLLTTLLVSLRAGLLVPVCGKFWRSDPLSRREEWGEEKCPRAVGSAVKVFPELVQERLGLVSLLVGYFLVCLTKSKGNCGTTPGLNAKLI